MMDDFQLAWHDGDDYPEWGSRPRRPLVRFDGAHQGEWMDSVIGPNVATGAPMVYHIVRCEYCILTHVWPLPAPAALAAYYAREFYQRDKPDYVARYERDRAWWEACVHGPILETCQGLLRLPPERPPRFLDIGAGPGIALDVAKQRGYVTYGIEPSRALWPHTSARGHLIHHGTLETFGGVSQAFHVVYLYETLEHQPNPEDFLLRCHDLLMPDGLLVVVVPNDYSPIQLAACASLGVPPYWLAPPQHLVMFTPKTLQLLLRRCGFPLVDLRGTFPLDKFLLEGHHYLGNDQVGRRVHAWRMESELYAVAHGQWAQREQEYRANMAQRVGREIVCIARRIA